ncbi:hypothetical protein INR49_016395 [Caranx melampygus]|nr:hypothetical protein INR49_016395 [Caranx melampygus]
MKFKTGNVCAISFRHLPTTADISHQRVVTRQWAGCPADEAAELSSLKPQLDELGVPLFAVVKEDVDSELQDFRLYFKGEIFVDQKRVFYGPKPRRMGLGLGLVRLGVLRNLVRVGRGKGYRGNKKGEGFILGGLFVIGRDKQGVLLEHKEKEFGHKADLSSVLEAARKINKSQ